MQENRKLKIPSKEERKLLALESKLETHVEIYEKTNKDNISLEELKKLKLNQLSQLCNEMILEGFIQVMDSKNYKFSSSLEAQSNFQTTDALFKDGLIKEVYWSATNIDNGIVERITLNKDSFDKLRVQMFNHINTNISRLRDILQPLVLSAKTNEEVDKINW